MLAVSRPRQGLRLLLSSCKSEFWGNYMLSNLCGEGWKRGGRIRRRENEARNEEEIQRVGLGLSRLPYNTLRD